MSGSVHQRARELIAVAEDENISGQQIWLRAHLEECLACSDYQQAAGRAVRALRCHPLAGDLALTRAAQKRVRSRTLFLRQRQQWMWMVALSCSFAGLAATMTTPLLWRAFARIGLWAGLSHWVWGAGFTFFWIDPTLVVSVLILACGAQLANNKRKAMEMNVCS